MDCCGILIIKEKVVRKLYVSIVPNQIGQRKSMYLNTDLWRLPISLSFWIRLVLDFIFKSPKGPNVSPQQVVSESKSRVRARIMNSRSRSGDDGFDVQSARRLEETSKVNTMTTKRKNNQVQPVTCTATDFDNVHQKEWPIAEMNFKAQIDSCA